MATKTKPATDAEKNFTKETLDASTTTQAHKDDLQKEKDDSEKPDYTESPLPEKPEPNPAIESAADYFKSNKRQFERLNESAQVWEYEKNNEFVGILQGLGKTLGEGKNATNTFEFVDVDSGAITLVPAWAHVKETLLKELETGAHKHHVYILTHRGKKEMKDGGTFHVCEVIRAPRPAGM